MIYSNKQLIKELNKIDDRARITIHCKSSNIQGFKIGWQKYDNLSENYEYDINNHTDLSREEHLDDNGAVFRYLKNGREKDRYYLTIILV
jgi:hypothetical protein